MNKRRTTACFRERGSIGIPLFGRLSTLSRRSVPSALLLLAFALLPCARVEGYQVLGNDRILLMNNDTWLGANKFSVTAQGYADAYWVHEGRGNSSFRQYLAGTNHVLYADAEHENRLWSLYNCRAGSAGGLRENYLPTSPTALSSGSGSSVALTNACVILRNTSNAQVVSPYYNQNGVGTIYFDTVNVYGVAEGAVAPTIQIQYATETVEGVEGSIEDVYDPSQLQWKVCPFDVLTVTDGVVQEFEKGVTSLPLRAPAK